jgi:zinc transporter
MADDPAPPSDGTSLRALLLDGVGGARPFAATEITGWTPERGRLWIDLALPDEREVALLEGGLNVDPFVLAALLVEETRPRWLESQGGLLVILRGVNLNPGAEPEDMVSLRLWSQPGLLVSTHLREIRALREIREALLEGRGPSGARDVLVALADRLVTRVGPVVGELEDDADGLEERLLEEPDDPHLPARLAALRRTTIRLRRHLAPQREVLIQLAAGQAGWLREHDRQRLNEVADRITRQLELLETIREHAAITQDELQNHIIFQTARTSYLLTVIAVLFLPLGFLTGLLGVNLAGIPGAESPSAFLLASSGLLLLGVAEYIVLRRLGWL